MGWAILRHVAFHPPLQICVYGQGHPEEDSESSAHVFLFKNKARFDNGYAVKMITVAKRAVDDPVDPATAIQ